MAARGEAVAVVELVEQRARASGVAPLSSRSARAVSCALQVRPVPASRRGLALARGDDPLADVGGRRRRLRAQRVGATGRPTVTETSMRSSSGPQSRRWWRARSAAEQRQAVLAHARTGTGSRRRRACTRVGKTIDPLRADDRHAAVLERLAQRLERRPR